MQQLTAPVPVYPAREKLTLSFGLERMREFLGPDYPLVRSLLAEHSPDTLAASLIDGTKLADPAVRKQLWEGGQAAIDASTDPMIRIARLVDPDARALRKQYEDEVEAVVDASQEKIAAARFAALGTSVYPDATFTLRLNYGTVQGWDEAGTPVAPFTSWRAPSSAAPAVNRSACRTAGRQSARSWTWTRSSTFPPTTTSSAAIPAAR